MDPSLRTALLFGGLIFLGLFALMTVTVAIEYGVDVLTFAALAIILMLGLALIGAIRHPPDD
jgi:peptidoglycan/LPS O-acetylase OafA/YrhL